MKHLRKPICALAVLLTLVSPGHAAPKGGDVDITFNPGAAVNQLGNGCSSIAVLPNGQMILAGRYQAVDFAYCTNLVRLNADGTPDLAFKTGMDDVDENGSVVMQLDGKLLIGGMFGSIGGVARSCIARLNADGSLDTGFQNGMAGIGFTHDEFGDLRPGTVLAITLQPDSKVMVAGLFDTVNGVTCTNIARLNGDGSLDTSFQSSSINSAILSAALQPDGKVLIGGNFTSINGTTRNRIARLNADGSLDTGFQNGMSGADNYVYSLVVQPDGKVLVGGNFTSLNGTSRSGVARLNADGSVDTGFQNGMSGLGGWGYVKSMALQTNGQLVIGGFFYQVNGAAHNSIARLNANGSLDAGFQNGMDGVRSEHGYNTTIGLVSAVAVQPDGKVLVGGGFDTINGEIRGGFARLNADGGVDTTFQNGRQGIAGGSAFFSMAGQPDGKLLVSGNFTSVGGVTRNGIARFNTNGTLDAGFQNGMSGITNSSYYYPIGEVPAMAVQPDGKIVIGGSFVSVNGTSRTNIARLNPDGSLDPSFQNGMSGADSQITSLALQSDGKVVLGGWFSSVNGVARNGIARLNSDGSLDSGFQNGMPGVTNSTVGYFPVYSLAVQSDGKVVIGGGFDTVNGVIRHGIARLNADGSLDTGFQNGMDGVSGEVNSVVLQPDGKALIRGNIDFVNGVARYEIARLNSDGSLDGGFQPMISSTNGLSYYYTMAVQPDGQVLVGGLFNYVNGAARNGIARLNPDGSVDTSFQNGMSGGEVDEFVVQPDGKIMIRCGLAFDGKPLGLNGMPIGYIARLFGSGSEPAIAHQPKSQIVLPGTNVSFTITVNGDPTLVYQWFKNGTNLIAAATNLSLTLTNVAKSAEGFYSVTVSNSLGWTISSNASLRVNLPPVADASATLPLVISDNGTDASVTLDGSHSSDPDNDPLQYDWYEMGSLETSGVVVAVVLPAGEHSIQLVVNDGAVAATNTVTVVVKAPPVFSNLGFFGNQFGFDITGESNNIVVEASTNLVSWIPISTNVLGVGPVNFRDLDSPNFKKRFYRARLQ